MRADDYERKINYDWPNYCNNNNSNNNNNNDDNNNDNNKDKIGNF